MTGHPETEWAARVQHHRRMMEAARRGWSLAEGSRCRFVSVDLGGRCTADAEPPHEHRIHEEDLP